MAHFSTCLALGGLLALAGAAQAQAPSFAPAVRYATGASTVPFSLVVADVNHDSKPDIISTHCYNTRFGTAVSVLMGNGNGTFQATANYVTEGANARGLAVADLNGDGHADIVTSNSGSDDISVLRGNGTGQFNTATTYSGGGTMPYDVEVADVNGDGRPDLLALNTGSATVGVLLNAGGGAFQAAVTYPTGTNSYPENVVVADVNGDGKLDLLTANSGSASAGVLLGNGNGTFQPVATYSVLAGTYSYQTFPNDIAVGDVNGDGRPDLLTSDKQGNFMALMLGNGNGTFQRASSYSTANEGQPMAVALADVNGDGKLDIVEGNFSSAGSVGIYPGNGNGTFLTGANGAPNGGPAYLFPIASSPQIVSVGDVAVVDVNGDGRRDLITANYTTSDVAVFLNATPLSARPALPGTTVSLFPNPAREAATLDLTGLPAAVTAVQARVLDVTGREVARHALSATQGAARAALPTASLAPGLYVVQLTAHDAQGTVAGTLAPQTLSVP